MLERDEAGRYYSLRICVNDEPCGRILGHQYIVAPNRTTGYHVSNKDGPTHEKLNLSFEMTSHGLRRKIREIILRIVREMIQR